VDCESRERFGWWREERREEGELVEISVSAKERMLVRKREWMGRKEKEMVIERRKI
jgi:hypothetical protein